MRVLGSRQFAMLTLGMSLPLLFSFQLKTPPAVLQGLPFILIWTWAVVSAITVPVLAGLQIIACVFHLRRQQNQGEAKAALSVHATALVVAIVAEIVFMSARRSGLDGGERIDGEASVPVVQPGAASVESTSLTSAVLGWAPDHPPCTLITSPSVSQAVGRRAGRC